MLRGLFLTILLVAAGVNAQLTRPAQQQPLMNFGTGATVLPQNFMAQQTGQINSPVLTPQQAMNLIPLDQLQTALNQRVAALGQQQFAGVQAQPAYQQPIVGAGIGGIQQPINTGLNFGAQQFGQPQVGLGQFAQQQPYGIGAQQQFGGLGVQQPIGGFGVGGFGVQQQQPFIGGAGFQQQPIMGAGGFQQQQPMFFGGQGAGPMMGL